MTKILRFLSGQIVTNTEPQNKQDLPTVCRSLLFVQPTLKKICQAPKVGQVARQMITPEQITCLRQRHCQSFVGRVYKNLCKTTKCKDVIRIP